MISAKSLRRFNLIALTLFGFVSPASAQDAGYAPPPMFDDMTPPMVRPAPNQDGNIVQPRVSPKEVPAAPGSVTTTTKTAPVPQKPVIAPAKPKMMQPIVEPKPAQKENAAVKPVVKPEVKKSASPAPVPPKKPEVKKPDVKPVEATKAEAKVQEPVAPTVPAVPPAPEKKQEGKREEPKSSEPETIEAKPVPKRDPKESAIQGPKTMPSLPTQSVDTQKTFSGDDGAVEKETMLERRQKEVAAEQKKEESRQPVVPAPKANVKPAAFDKNAQGALKKVIPFQQGQIGLSSAEVDPIAAAVNKELDGEEKEDWRVQIRSYATPYGTGVSSDKRIALSRALSLRTALIAQGVPAARIDVLAEGQSQDGGKQGDRIDLYLYGPQQD